jgi:hypothetical protein
LDDDGRNVNDLFNPYSRIVMGMRCDVDSFGGAWERWSMKRERGARRNRRWRGKVLMTSKRRCVYERGGEGMERSGELNNLFFCGFSPSFYHD